MSDQNLTKRFALTPKLGQLICDALGIASDQCNRLVITIESDPMIVTIEATLYATEQINDIDWKAELGEPVQGNDQ